MSEARAVLDEVTTAITSGDLDRAAGRYAIDAILVAPDAGEVKGRTAIVQYFRTFVDAFADLRWEPIAFWDSGDVAIDEGYFGGTHTADLRDPSGRVVPATGNTVRVRECDVATVVEGMITSHHMYFDQMQLLEQLDQLPEAGA